MISDYFLHEIIFLWFSVFIYDLLESKSCFSLLIECLLIQGIASDLGTRIYGFCCL